MGDGLAIPLDSFTVPLTLKEEAAHLVTMSDRVQGETLAAVRFTSGSWLYRRTGYRRKSYPPFADAMEISRFAPWRLSTWLNLWTISPKSSRLVPQPSRSPTAVANTLDDVRIIVARWCGVSGLGRCRLAWLFPALLQECLKLTLRVCQDVS